MHHSTTLVLAFLASIAHASPVPVSVPGAVHNSVPGGPVNPAALVHRCIEHDGQLPSVLMSADVGPSANAPIRDASVQAQGNPSSNPTLNVGGAMYFGSSRLPVSVNDARIPANDIDGSSLTGGVSMDLNPDLGDGAPRDLNKDNAQTSDAPAPPPQGPSDPAPAPAPPADSPAPAPVDLPSTTLPATTLLSVTASVPVATPSLNVNGLAASRVQGLRIDLSAPDASQGGNLLNLGTDAQDLPIGLDLGSDRQDLLNWVIGINSRSTQDLAAINASNGSPDSCQAFVDDINASQDPLAALSVDSPVMQADAGASLPSLIDQLVSNATDAALACPSNAGQLDQALSNLIGRLSIRIPGLGDQLRNNVDQSKLARANMQLTMAAIASA